MWKTVALLALAAWPAVAHGQTLTIANPRLTYGYFGPKRADTKFLPGDVVILAYDLKNVSFDKDGKAAFTVGMEVTDAAGKSLYKQPPRMSRGQNYLGGDSLSAFASLPIPPEYAAGTYTITVTVEDKATKASKSVSQKVEVLPVGFGLVNVGTSIDPDGAHPIAPVATLGETVYLNFAAIGFAREEAGDKNPNLSVTMRILDENGKDTLARPMKGKAREGIDPTLKVIPMSFGVTLNRAGRFTLELTATCEICGKSTKTTFPIKVMPVE